MGWVFGGTRAISEFLNDSQVEIINRWRFEGSIEMFGAISKTDKSNSIWVAVNGEDD